MDTQLCFKSTPWNTHFQYRFEKSQMTPILQWAYFPLYFCHITFNCFSGCAKFWMFLFYKQMANLWVEIIWKKILKLVEYFNIFMTLNKDFKTVIRGKSCNNDGNGKEIHRSLGNKFRIKTKMMWYKYYKEQYKDRVLSLLVISLQSH